MLNLQASEAVRATIIDGMSLIQDGIESMTEKNPNSGIGARLTGQKICDYAIAATAETLRVTPDGELYGANSGVVFAMREIYPEAFSWYMAQTR